MDALKGLSQLCSSGNIKLIEPHPTSSIKAVKRDYYAKGVIFEPVYFLEYEFDVMAVIVSDHSLEYMYTCLCLKIIKHCIFSGTMFYMYVFF